jgi:glutamyl-tRNA(Gln) amidotransferase subunit D
MYSEKIRKLLKEKRLEVGDRAVVEKNGRIYEGVLMPRIESGNRSCIVLKLDSGYNVGIDCMGVRISKAKDIPIEPEGHGTGRVRFGRKKPQVSIVTTGGTITSRVDYKTGGVTSLTSPAELVQKVPQLADFVRLKIVNPFTIMSESMTHNHWQKMAAVVGRELRTSEGVIVTQGTDTLHYTAAALSFMLKDLGKPVILTGAQRSTDRGSSDGFMNLVCAARAAISDMSGVGVCMHGTMNDEYCILIRGTRTRKMHASRRDAFRPVNDLPLAKIWPDGRMEKMQSVPGRGKKAAKADTAFEDKVAMIKSYPGAKPDIIDYYVKKGYRGLVIGATGLGQVPTHGRNSWLGSIGKAVERGMLVSAAAETIYGRLNPNVYAEGRTCMDAGLFYLGDMPMETAYVKLGWVLGHTRSVEKAKEMMLTNYAGEVQARSLADTFLY